ncbi:MAG: Ni/Fe-hydrogenase, b-type cytochrome subunit [Propionibacteriaceae bacterium]|jgi:Ni/Fe-hydrogenase b-type cytochrome subunit|nr:Ni/Fe-hydrogenase, b-type cytochrome subunit [Propionibacteriaceae bacterium]
MTAEAEASPRIKIGSGFAVSKMSEGRILALAAVAAPADSDDPVDVAVREALEIQRPDLITPPADPADIDPATPERRYTVARCRSFPLKDNAEPADVVIMRGNLEDVLAKVKTSRKDRSLLHRNADFVTVRDWRPLAVATALVDPKTDEVGEFRMQGFIDVGLEGISRGITNPGAADWVRVQIWSLSLRFQHWINVAMIFTLSCTGYFIMNPFFGPEATGVDSSGFLMGWIRLIHFSAAALWVVLGLTRVVSAFVARDPHLRWTEWWPLKKKRDVKNLVGVVQHYALIKEEGPLYMAHNPLQQLTYGALYCACGLQMISGFALFGLYHQNNIIWQLAALPAHWFGIATIRLFHTGMMFALWMFVVMHVYLAVRADSMERHGGISSMINGSVWLRRGSKPEDGPEVG